MATNPREHDSVEMPRPTAWPIVIAAAVALLALGVATSLVFCILGGVLLVLSLIGWIVQLLPGRGHEHEPLAEHAQRASLPFRAPALSLHSSPASLATDFNCRKKYTRYRPASKGASSADC